VHDYIIRVALEGQCRELLPHPLIERLMQEHVCQQWTDDSPLRGALRQLCQRTLTVLRRCFQPAFNVQKLPFFRGVLPRNLQHQLVVDIVKEPFDINIDNPVVLPAPLPCHSYCFFCRFARAIPI